MEGLVLFSFSFIILGAVHNAMDDFLCSTNLVYVALRTLVNAFRRMATLPLSI